MNTMYISRKDGSTFSTGLTVAGDTITLPFGSDVEKIVLKLAPFKVPVGSEGYFLLPNMRSSSSCGGLIFFRKRPAITEEYNESFAIPLVGVTTGEKALMAVVTACRYDYKLLVEVKDGFYNLSFVFAGCHENPVIKLFNLEGKDANYAGMARAYRNYQLATGACKPLKERIVNNPVLEESTRAIMVRMRMGWKPVPPDVLEQTEENEPPMLTAITFARAEEILRRCKEKGIKHAEFCLVGWQKGGHDGAFPDLFPINDVFGGEAGLRKLLATAQELNYPMAAHTNLIDSYSFSKRVSPQDWLVDPDGTYHLGGKWGGGQSYYLCPECACKKFAAEDFKNLWDLGFRGTHYLDVASIKQPDACYSPDHPLTKEENAAWRNRIFAMAREVFGAVSSEGSIDFCAGDLDFVLYVNFGIQLSNAPVLCERLIPFWSLVYHGIITANCAYSTVNEMVKDDPDLWLYNLEWGGRPTAYFHSKFRPTTDGVAADMRCATDEELEQGVTALAARAAEFDKLAYLQLEYIEEHDEIAPGVIRECYSDGTVIVINRSAETFDGIPSKSYRVTRSC